MLISQLDPDDLSKEVIERLLYSYHDDGNSGDMIFVPGSSKCVDIRLPVAIDLYKIGRAKTLMLSGGVVWRQLGQTKPEAVLMKERAVELGVNETDILIETRSLYTKANVLESLQIIKGVGRLTQVRRLLLVTSAYHMRRLHLTMKTYWPRLVEYTFCPAQDKTTRFDNWWLSEIGFQRVMVEAKKIVQYVRDGYLVDDVI